LILRTPQGPFSFPLGPRDDPTLFLSNIVEYWDVADNNLILRINPKTGFTDWVQIGLDDDPLKTKELQWLLEK